MTPTDPVEHLARTVAVEAHAGQDEPPLTLAQAVLCVTDALFETQSIPELDADGNRIGPDRDAEWDGMDDDPQTVRVDIEALWLLLWCAREALGEETT